LRSRKVAWNKLSQFFAVNPGELDRLLSANNRFIFFTEQVGGAPVGSLGLPVVEERSIAIDQLHLPPGAVSIIRTALPHRDGKGNLRLVPSSRFVLNLDSGSAIRGPGRVDVFMGTGEEARQRANYVHGDGELYYLFVKRRRDVTVQARARVDDSARASLRRPDGASAVVPAKAGTRRGADR
jgi:membrane-bound lytic murein transglycosylase A